MLSTDRAVLVIVDVQGRLAELMHNRESLYRNLAILIQGAQLLSTPILWLEQNPRGLGPTIAEMARLLPAQQPMAKMSFSACGSPEFLQALRQTGRHQVLLAGIEAHVCIYLSAADLVSLGYEVHVVADAVSSRSADNKQIGLGLIAALGASLTSTETVLFELLGRADNPHFKRVVQLLK